MQPQIDLEPEFSTFVTELLATGRFESEAEVVQEGLRLLREREHKLADLDAAIERGLADAAAGRMFTLDEAEAFLEARFSVDAERA